MTAATGRSRGGRWMAVLSDVLKRSGFALVSKSAKSHSWNGLLDSAIVNPHKV